MKTCPICHSENVHEVSPSTYQCADCGYHFDDAISTRKALNKTGYDVERMLECLDSSMNSDAEKSAIDIVAMAKEMIALKGKTVSMNDKLQYEAIISVKNATIADFEKFNHEKDEQIQAMDKEIARFTSELLMTRSEGMKAAEERVAEIKDLNSENALLNKHVDDAILDNKNIIDDNARVTSEIAEMQRKIAVALAYIDEHQPITSEIHLDNLEKVLEPDMKTKILDGIKGLNVHMGKLEKIWNDDINLDVHVGLTSAQLVDVERAVLMCSGCYEDVKYIVERYKKTFSNRKSGFVVNQKSGSAQPSPSTFNDRGGIICKCGHVAFDHDGSGATCWLPGCDCKCFVKKDDPPTSVENGDENK